MYFTHIDHLLVWSFPDFHISLHHLPYFVSVFQNNSCGGSNFSRQFQLKHLFIARLIHRCGYFIVKVGERCGSLPCQDLFRIKTFLCEGARDLAWVLLRALGLPVTYLPDPVKSKGCASSTQEMCLWVMRLSSMVTGHLLDFKVCAFNNCWLLIILKNTSRHWVLRCSQAT